MNSHLYVWKNAKYSVKKRFTSYLFTNILTYALFQFLREAPRPNQSHLITFHKCNYIISTLCGADMVLSKTNLHMSNLYVLSFEKYATHHTHSIEFFCRTMPFFVSLICHLFLLLLLKWFLLFCIFNSFNLLLKTIELVHFQSINDVSYNMNSNLKIFQDLFIICVSTSCIFFSINVIICNLTVTVCKYQRCGPVMVRS